MTLAASFQKYTLKFKFLAGTSRGVMRERDTYFLKIWDGETSEHSAMGEAGPLSGLSPEFEEVTQHLTSLCRSIQQYQLPTNPGQIPELVHHLVKPEAPSVRFALESSLLDLVRNNQSADFNPIPINGLIWMGDFNFMKKQVDEKVAEGYRCIKIKIGALEFERECALLEYIRKSFDQDIVLRVDANGAFTTGNVVERLERLSGFKLHSIEQPVKPGQPKLLQSLCLDPLVPVALDEELIGITDPIQQEALLDFVKPQYVVLKPTLLGGFDMTDRWIKLADQRGIGWWITSALESNVGLNAIARYTASKDPVIQQGLGTGQLYHNNVPPENLQLKNGFLNYHP
jgi:o-succinylbenzoate synthase